MNLIILEPHELGDFDEATLSDGRAVHLLKVLKAAPGQSVRIGLLDGPCGIGTVQSIGDGTVTLRCAFDADIPARPRVDLLLALPRPKVMRRIWAQVAALGVGQIILTHAGRVERNYFDTHWLTPDVYRPLLIEGLQQARDTRLPSVSIYRQFRILIEDTLDGLFGEGVRLMADPAADLPAGAVAREGAREGDGRILLAVGPEGGWNDFERELLQKHRFLPVGMGPRTLRTDTACVALLALIHEAIK